MRPIEEATRTGEAGNHDDAAQAYVHWQWSHLCTGDYEGVLRLETEILRTLEDNFNLRWYLFAVTAASLAYSWLGRWDEAVAEAEKAFRMGSEFADNSVIAFAAFTLSHAYTAKGDLPQALSYGELAVDKAPTPADKVWSQSFLCWALCRAGQPQRGVDFLVQSVAMQRGARFIWSEVCALWLGEGYWRLGEHDKARQTLEELESTAQRCGMQFLVGSARRLLGELTLLDNPVEAAAFVSCASINDRSAATAPPAPPSRCSARSVCGSGRALTLYGRSMVLPSRDAAFSVALTSTMPAR